MSSRIAAKFEDCDLFSVHFSPQAPKNDGFTEFGTQTSSILASDCTTQTVVSLEGGTQTEAIGTSTQEDSKENDVSLDQVTPFLNKKVESMEREITNNISSTVFNNYPDQSSSVFGSVSQNESTEEFVTLEPPACAVGLQCTSVGWNASGGLLIASYGRLDVSGWCSDGGVLSGWSIFRRDFDIKAPPEVILEHSSCLMSLACHPDIPYLCAAGSYNGEVLIVDMSSGETTEARLVSRIDDYFHREPVRSLQWVWDDADNDYHIASSSSDGKVLWWKRRNNLKFPLCGAKLSLQRQSDGLRGLGLLSSAVHGATSIAFTYGGNGKAEMSSTMVVGTEAGAVFGLQPMSRTGGGTVLDAGWEEEAGKMLGYVTNESSRESVKGHVERWKKLNSQALGGKIDPETIFRSKPDPDLLFNAAVSGRTRFESHAGPVLCVDASPFHRNLFATAGADGALKISSTLQARPILTIDPNAGHQEGGLGGVLHNVSWSRTRPLVLGVCSSLGQYSIFDLGKSTSLPVVKLNKEKALHCSSFNHRMRSFLALGWADGVVSVHRLPAVVCDPLLNESEVLKTLISDLSDSTESVE